MTAFIGVRISWLIVARNALLAVLALSAAVADSRRSAVRVRTRSAITLNRRASALSSLTPATRARTSVSPAAMRAVAVSSSATGRRTARRVTAANTAMPASSRSATATAAADNPRARPAASAVSRAVRVSTRVNTCPIGSMISALACR